MGEGVTMECNIDHGDLTILSISWSKDGKLFYKYDPNQSDPIIIYDLQGVQVKVIQHISILLLISCLLLMCMG